MAEEINLPQVKAIMSEHKALGMLGKMEFASGIDKMEAKVKWNSFYKDVLKSIGNPFQFNLMMIRGSISAYDSAGLASEKPIVVYMTGSCKDFPMGNFKQHENAEVESNFAVFYAKMEIDGENIFEFDATANVFKVAGQDIASTYRANIGA